MFGTVLRISPASSNASKDFLPSIFYETIKRRVTRRVIYPYVAVSTILKYFSIDPRTSDNTAVDQCVKRFWFKKSYFFLSVRIIIVIKCDYNSPMDDLRGPSAAPDHGPCMALRSKSANDQLLSNVCELIWSS